MSAHYYSGTQCNDPYSRFNFDSSLFNSHVTPNNEVDSYYIFFAIYCYGRKLQSVWLQCFSVKKVCHGLVTLADFSLHNFANKFPTALLTFLHKKFNTIKNSISPPPQLNRMCYRRFRLRILVACSMLCEDFFKKESIQ